MSDIDEVVSHVHVYRGVQSTNQLKEKRVVGTNFRYINVLEAINHTILTVDGTPDLVALERSVGLPVLYKVHVYRVGVIFIIFFTPITIYLTILFYLKRCKKE
jgi:hypothetical protein